MTESELQEQKAKFGIIGNDPKLNRAIEVAFQVAPTDLSVLVTGESGVGKEFFPKIIHNNSARKHGPYIAVNCGAIPEGTVDSELFGHEKGAFTGAISERKGYFEVADGGTIFLDEVGELPLTTQVRLLRVLEVGEFSRVGSSKVLKTNVRVVAATNLKMQEAVEKGTFREDLYYRLNTIQISVPSLRERHDDIYLLFRKFASDFAEKYHTDPVRLDEEAVVCLKQYNWSGNVRQIRNVTNQISLLESENKKITKDVLLNYLPDFEKNSIRHELTIGSKDNVFNSGERELLYSAVHSLRQEVEYLKGIVERRGDIVPTTQQIQPATKINTLPLPHSTPAIEEDEDIFFEDEDSVQHTQKKTNKNDVTEIVEVNTSSLSIDEAIRKLTIKALETCPNNRKAAEALGINERTLYRYIEKYDLGKYKK
ncbi:MAG: sigma 54-interacting transcriptional regulator [Paludibacteraceae bacterium]|nr:sigma 54-interacting transcriptional regulator [Paludibacteraceae bacterium]